ncbi:MAG: DUF1648 domain-containing protein [Phocaeicola sp.]|uniref:DUF1648 domain-containing protein n=1 Tax=Phocaeicola sp. TaxID=2773926 RepID=UPI003F9EBB67
MRIFITLHTDKILILVSIFIVLITIILSIIIYPRLPETIPTHFNALMEADGFGSKSNIYFINGINIVCVTLTILSSFFPNLVNLPIRLNPERLAIQQNMCSRMCRVLSVWCSILFLSIILSMSAFVLPSCSILWRILFFISITGVIGTSVVYTIKIYRAGK